MMMMRPPSSCNTPACPVLPVCPLCPPATAYWSPRAQMPACLLLPIGHQGLRCLLLPVGHQGLGCLLVWCPALGVLHRRVPVRGALRGLRTQRTLPLLPPCGPPPIQEPGLRLPADRPPRTPHVRTDTGPVHSVRIRRRTPPCYSRCRSVACAIPPRPPARLSSFHQGPPPPPPPPTVVRRAF